MMLIIFNCQAVDHYLTFPINNELAGYQLSDMEWSVLSDFQVILEVRFLSNMHWCTLTTSHWNRFLIGCRWLWLVKQPQFFLVQFQPSRCLCRSGNKSQLYPRLSRWINVGLHWATQYYKCMDWTKAYIMWWVSFSLYNWLYVLSVSSSESQHLHELDPSKSTVTYTILFYGTTLITSVIN